MLNYGFFFYVPEDVAVTPKNGKVICDRWWSVHPEYGLCFYNTSLRPTIEGEINAPSPQCNQSKFMCEKLMRELNPGCEVKFFPVVFLEHAMVEQCRLYQANKDDE
jgi:hypothetical protein